MSKKYIRSEFAKLKAITKTTGAVSRIFVFVDVNHTHTRTHNTEQSAWRAAGPRARRGEASVRLDVYARVQFTPTHRIAGSRTCQRDISAGYNRRAVSVIMQMSPPTKEPVNLPANKPARRATHDAGQICSRHLPYRRAVQSAENEP